ncbi:hypothetical protein VU06_02770 [Desulfobulbus sp. F3]|nr:hypothetical protein [Desulfobulbus sp. F3]
MLLKEAAGLVAGAHVGKRDDAGAAALWNSVSEDCKKNGIFFTDGFQAKSAGIGQEDIVVFEKPRKFNRICFEIY